MNKSQHPELDKIKAVSEDSRKLGEFLEWLRAQGYVFAQWVDHEHTEDCYQMEESPFNPGKMRPTLACSLNEGDENFLPVSWNINDLLAQYFGIDQDQAERERRAILESLRSQ